MHNRIRFPKTASFGSDIFHQSVLNNTQALQRCLYRQRQLSGLLVRTRCNTGRSKDLLCKIITHSFYKMIDRIQVITFCVYHTIDVEQADIVTLLRPKGNFLFITRCRRCLFSYDGLVFPAYSRSDPNSRISFVFFGRS